MVGILQLKHQSTKQPSLPGLCPIDNALAKLSQAGLESRGAVFTRREVVEFILDLVGYTINRPLWNSSLLEPSCGNGDFVLPAVERLMTSWTRMEHPIPARRLARCIRAIELHQVTFEETRARVPHALCSAGISEVDAAALTECWLVHGDFLLTDHLPPTYEFVVGNPPYVRQELIPDALVSEYRARYETVFDRADLYVPFIERSVKLLSPEGKLGIICADRWMKNRYGGPLRRLLTEQFQLHIYVDMVGTPAFHSDVIAYPGIFVIGREKTGKTRVARRPEIKSCSLARLTHSILDHKAPDPGGPVNEISRIPLGTQPWILNPSEEFTLVRRLERDFLPLENAACKVGIGVATGADKAFVGPYDEIDVEDDRKLPLVTTRDIQSGDVRWQGLGVVNPFRNTGGLVPLSEYPRLNRYFDERRADLMARHVSRKTPSNWYRTIDRIYPALAITPKLLIPDIKGEAHIVYEGGRFYPHHNLYYITSRKWELEALQAILLSGIAKLFVSAYSTRMRGGYLRFQAQYLRRIRIPCRSSVPDSTASLLVEAAASRDTDACNVAVAELYQLTLAERALIAPGPTLQHPGP